MRSWHRAPRSGLALLGAAWLVGCVATSPNPSGPASLRSELSPTPSLTATATATEAPSERAGWQLLPMSAFEGPAFLESVTTFRGALVAVGNTTSDTSRGAIWCSKDGLGWGSCPRIPPLDGTTLTSLGIGEPGLVVVAGSDAGAVAFLSADGLTWSGSILPGGPHRSALAVAWHAGRYLAIGIDYETESSPTFAWASDDGRSWTALPDVGKAGQAPNYGLVGVPEGFVAAGSFLGHGAIWTSTDGREWTRSSLPGSPDGSPGRLQLVGGRLFLPMGPDLWISNDARHWSKTTIPGFGNGVFAVGSIPGGFVAVGRSSEGDQPGVVAVADAGLARWTLQPSDPAFVDAVAHDLVVSPDGLRLVAVGNSIGGSSVLIHADPAGFVKP